MSSDLFGPSRLNTWRVELLDLDGRVLGDLDWAPEAGRPGLQPGAQLEFGAQTDLKVTGKATVISPIAGLLDWTQYRLRFWYTGTGANLTEPLATLVPTAAPQTFPSTYVQESLELHSTLTLLAGDGPGMWYGVDAGVEGATALETILGSVLGAGRYLVDESSVVLSAGLTWDDEPSWLKICNKICSTIGFWSLRPDPFGVVRAERYVDPQDRPVAWTFDDGPHTGLYMPGWTRDRDLLQPNRVVITQRVEGEDTPLTAEAVLPDGHPRSASAIGRTITRTYPDQDFADQPAGDALAARLLADLVPTESRLIEHPWLPGVVPNAVVLHQRTGMPDLKATVQNQSITLATDGLYRTELRGLL